MSASGTPSDDELRAETERAALIFRIARWGVDIGGCRYGVVYGWDKDHLMESGATVTLCGLSSPEVIEDDAAVPSCARCLKIVERGLQSTPLDPVLADIAAGAVETMAKSGSVGIGNVPGDQAERLRAEIRRLMRARKLNVSTYVIGSSVFAHSTDVYYAIPEEVREAEIREALERIFG